MERSEIPAERALFSKRFLVYLLGAFLCFSSGYFIHSGKEAKASGSWAYIQGPVDNIFYWSVARGRMTEPRSDGNPFFFEQAGTRNAVPYTTAELVGLAAKYTRIPLRWFFPVWHILMPLVAWGVLVGCLWRLWRYSLEVSACVTTLLFSASIFSASYWGFWFFRFSRPADGLPWLYLWISLLFKGDAQNKKHLWLLGACAFCALWLHPFYAVFGLWLTFCEALGCCGRWPSGKIKMGLSLSAFLGGLVGALSFYVYTHTGSDLNRAIVDYVNTFRLYFSSTMLALGWCVFFVSVIAVWKIAFKKAPTLLDRLVLEIAVFGFLAMMLQAYVFKKAQLWDHLHYFSMIQILATVAWTYEKLRWLKTEHKLVGAELFFAGLTVVYLLLRNFFNINVFNDSLPQTYNEHFLVYATWFYYSGLGLLMWVRFEGVALTVSKFKKTTACVMAALMLFCFWQRPLNPANLDYPFAGAHAWFRENAKANDVVLNTSLRYQRMDYLFFSTGLKSYYDIYGEAFAVKRGSESLRPYLFASILAGGLDDLPMLKNYPFYGKLHFLKLDYILAERDSPFLPFVNDQLRSFLQEVYRDDRCLILKVL